MEFSFLLLQRRDDRQNWMVGYSLSLQIFSAKPAAKIIDDNLFVLGYLLSVPIFVIPHP